MVKPSPRVEQVARSRCVRGRISVRFAKDGAVKRDILCSNPSCRLQTDDRDQGEVVGCFVGFRQRRYLRTPVGNYEYASYKRLVEVTRT